MSATLFCEHCRHVCFVSGAGRNCKNRLLSQKFPQAGSVYKQKKTRSYLWKKAPHQPITKSYGKTRDLVAEEQGKLWEGQQQKSDSDSDSEF